MYMSKYLNTQPNCNVTLLAPYGRDFLTYLTDENIANKPKADPTLLYRNESTGVYRKQSAKNSEFAKPVRITGEISNIISKADILIFAPLLPNYSSRYVQKLFNYAPSDCITVLSPQGYFRKVNLDNSVSYQSFTEATRIVSLFNIVITSNEDLPNAKNELTHWSEASSNTNIIMTEGEEGASIIKGGKLTRVPTVPIPKQKVVDSVGCGDVFTAATALDFYRTRNIISAVQAGNKAAGKRLLTKIV